MISQPDTTDIKQLVDTLVEDALRYRASDVHVEPAADAWEIRFRIDGVLQTQRTIDAAIGRAIVTRLMVLGKLLTYRLDVPQEGRISFQSAQQHTVELRLSIMPTIHGMRAAIRMPAEQAQPAVLDELGLPDIVLAGLKKFAVSAEGGMLILTGPAGSGKTTTIYALLRQIAALDAGVSIIALEDPVERDIPGVTQIEVSPFGQLTYEKALRSILRQDPQVLMLGEVRDATTASLAVQAALSGHRLITALHAATPAGALARLLEMGIEPYQLTSSVQAIISQRLMRRRSLDGAGYLGRVPVAEYVELTEKLRSALLRRSDAATLAAAYRGDAGYQSLEAAGERLVEAGITDASELDRCCPGRAAH